jgi:DNA-directed RNA polymerase subunit M/transcription elongation factor TFIIS
MFDVEYMFAKLRSKSVGETSTVMIPCEKCEEKNEATIDLENNLIVGEVPDNKVALSSDTGLIMKYPNMSEYLDLAQNDKLEPIDKIFGLVAISIDQIYAGDEVFDAADQTKDELLDFIGNLSSEQFGKVKAYLDAMPQATVNVQFKCQSCGHDNNIELKGLKNFFS